MPNFVWIEFFAHFWQYCSVTFFWLGQKTKSDFFHKRITSYLLNNAFWRPEKLAAVLHQSYFGKFCYCVPMWKILKHCFLYLYGVPFDAVIFFCLGLDLLFRSILMHCEFKCPIHYGSLSIWYFVKIFVIFKVLVGLLA